MRGTRDKDSIMEWQIKIEFSMLETNVGSEGKQRAFGDYIHERAVAF